MEGDKRAGYKTQQRLFFDGRHAERRKAACGIIRVACYRLKAVHIA